MTVNLNDYLCFNMRAAMKRIDKVVAEYSENHNISTPQSFILLCLLANDGITLKEIGVRTLIDSSSMTVLVDKLENEGLVMRQLDPADRRAIRVFLTAAGNDLAKIVYKYINELNDKLLSVLGSENETGFIKGLNNLAEKIN